MPIMYRSSQYAPTMYYGTIRKGKCHQFQPLKLLLSDF